MAQGVTVCPHCNGTGWWIFGRAVCAACKGEGIQHDADEDGGGRQGHADEEVARHDGA